MNPRGRTGEAVPATTRQKALAPRNVAELEAIQYALMAFHEEHRNESDDADMVDICNTIRTILERAGIPL